MADRGKSRNWQERRIRSALAEETRQAVLDAVYGQWLEVRTKEITPEIAVDALAEGLLAAAAALISTVTAPDKREAMPRLAANRLIHQFKITRERETDPND
ncbi:hypothetical protein F9K90_07775 [Brucella anthropi]|uniref:hypothetical protein n=1 Tax=Brucella anthropi TaxID=529 RepID=UPI00124DF211|nr:hypothetical protein [Brucella anthropi]KAB2738569.1 hypothetical protein F9K90_07775 [Brucella anthropi]